MINLAPGQGLGRVDRPFLALALGYMRSRSQLVPVGPGIVGSVAGDLTSTEDHALTSKEAPEIESLEIQVVDPERGIYAITGVIAWDLNSKQPVEIVGELPEDIIALIPKDLYSEEPLVVESREPDDLTSEEP